MRVVEYYEAGTMRACVGCGAEFPRAVRPVSRCPACQKIKKKEWDARAKDRKKAAKEGQERPRPRLRSAGHYGDKWEGVEIRETKVTFLPTCAICRCYPATLINGIYMCGGQHV